MFADKVLTQEQESRFRVTVPAGSSGDASTRPAGGPVLSHVGLEAGVAQASSLPCMRCAQGVAGLWGHLAAPIKKEAGQLSQKCQSQSSGHHESPSTVLLSLQRPQAP